MKTRETWKRIGEKADAHGHIWQLWTKGDLVKRSTMSGNKWGFTSTFYWKRGTFFYGDPARPAWFPTLEMLNRFLDRA